MPQEGAEEPAVIAPDHDALAKYVNDTSEESSDFIQECAQTAADMVGRYVAAYGFTPYGVSQYGGPPIPASVAKRAVLEVGAELYHRKAAPSGVKQFATEFGGTPLRIARDPMVAARPLLAPYLPGGFA